MMNQMMARAPGAPAIVITRAAVPAASLAGLEVRKGSIRGWFDPVIDPRCVCLVQIVFEGSVDGTS